MRAVGVPVVVAAALILGSGTAVAAPASVTPVAATGSSDGGSGDETCSYLPGSLQELLCPSADGETSDGGGSAAAGGTGGGSSASSAPTGGTTGATTPAPGASGAGAPAQGGVVSNFLTWLAGLFQYIGL